MTQNVNPIFAGILGAIAPKPTQTIGEALAPVLLRAIQQERAPQVAANLETINEYRGLRPHADDAILGMAVRRLGLEGAFTFEALALMAEEYRSQERLRQNLNARNRAIWAAQEATRGQ